MKERDIIKSIMAAKEVTNAVLAHRLGITSATIWDRLNNKEIKKGMSLAMVSEMVRNLDYKIVIVPRGARLPEGGYEVD